MKTYVKLGIGVLSVVALLIVNWRYQPKAEHVHYHAGFIVYIDGVRQDYSDYKYMNYELCSEHDKKLSAKGEQIEKAHLHDGVGDTVHVHRDNAAWGDLFKNIGTELPKDKELKGYIKGTLNEDILHAPIKPYTSAVFVVGASDASHDKEVIEIDYIKQVEAKSELCASDK